MRIGVGQGTETVVVLLTSCIPESQLDMLAVNLDVGNIVLEDGGDIDLRTQMLEKAASMMHHSFYSERHADTRSRSVVLKSAMFDEPMRSCFRTGFSNSDSKVAEGSSGLLKM